MQNIKGAIRLFAILMGICCVFYLSFTWVTYNQEKKAKKYAKDYINRQAVKDLAMKKTGGDQNRMYDFLDSVRNERENFYLYDSLGEKPIYFWLFTYKDCKERELNLGLDLKGGMNVTLEVSVPDILRSLALNPNDPAFSIPMTKALEERKKSNEDFITIFLRNFKASNPNTSLASVFHSERLKERIKFSSTDGEVEKELRKESTDAIESAKQILETRINKFGVAQPNIQMLSGSGRILVELPGVKEKERVRKLLQGSANLEFWETYSTEEVIGSFYRANQELKVMLGLEADTAAVRDSIRGLIVRDSTLRDSVAKLDTKDKNKKKLDDSLKLVVAPKMPAADTTKKADKKGGRDPLFELMVPNLIPTGQGQQPRRLVYDLPVVGFAAVKDTQKVMEYMRDPQISALFPPDLKLVWSVKPDKDDLKMKLGKGPNVLRLIALKSTLGGGPSLEGDVVTDARVAFRQEDGGTPTISMSMNSVGATQWRNLTAANKQKSEQDPGHAIAIVLDGYAYSYPRVISEIPNGESSITGNFSIKDAEDIVTVLKAGRMPAPARIVEETIVGATLGSEAIRAGLLSFIVALVVVLIYMVFYYNRAGWVADVALFVNVFFIMGILTSLGAVLTLPGIAGVVLTIALSVDANILIFERVREELREGKSIGLAVADGYKHAMSSILDSNLTTLILGIILYSFGTGPVQGFATTLIIGILSSLFCAIFITRIIFDRMLGKNQPIKFSRPATENVLRHSKFDFVGKRMYFYMFSGAIIITGAIFFVKHGFTQGVDFTGGRTYTVRYKSDQNTEKVRQALKVSFGEAPEVKTSGGNDQHKITTNYRINETDPTIAKEAEEKLDAGLDGVVGKGNYQVISSTIVGPSIAKDVLYKSYIVVFLSCVLMFLYILFRFRKWQYGLGAVAALLHDVLVVLSCYTIFDGILPFSLEIDQHFIAAILTVMGYSMTDTVVVFDRIREFLTAKKQDLATAEKKSLINYALNATLSRTINTSMITFFVLLAIFIFGGEVIRGFSFALLIGIVIGTYSSLCIATPIVVDFERRRSDKK